MNRDYSYRPEIDGLRAVAIIPVVIFHAGFGFFDGGFVGVDVFFAISGFLITAIILRELEAETFTLEGFYRRRIRRLAPVALFVYAATLVVFAFQYPPDLFTDTAKAAGFSAIFVSNIFFWTQGGYFGPNLELNPFLHTWSLSVEEQFYLFFPAVVLLLHKYSSVKIKIIVISLGVLSSLMLAIYLAPPRGSFAAFYILPTRAYELGLGAIIALFMSSLNWNGFSAKLHPKALGLTLIISSVMLYTPSTPFPSYFALLPIFGSCLILSGTLDHGFAHKFLCSSGMVYIGKISYSLYMIHWPVIALLRWRFSDFDEQVSLKVFATSLSMLVAHAMYRYIEKPTRDPKQFNDAVILRLGVVGIVCTCFISLGLAFMGNAQIVDPNGKIQETVRDALVPEPYRTRCFNYSDQRMKAEPQICEFKDGAKNIHENQRRILFWGDSHGSALVAGFDELAKQNQVFFVNIAGCPPIVGVDRTAKSHGNCSQRNERILRTIESGAYDLVILVGAFNNYLNKQMLISSDNSLTIESAKAFETGLGRTATTILSNQVGLILVPQAPRYKSRIPEEFSRQMITQGRVDDLSITVEEYHDQSTLFRLHVPDELQDNIFPIEELFCSDEECFALDGNQLRYKDAHHISNYQAKAVGTALATFIMSRNSWD